MKGGSWAPKPVFPEDKDRNAECIIRLTILVCPCLPSNKQNPGVPSPYANQEINIPLILQSVRCTLIIVSSRASIAWRYFLSLLWFTHGWPVRVKLAQAVKLYLRHIWLPLPSVYDVS